MPIAGASNSYVEVAGDPATAPGGIGESPVSRALRHCEEVTCAQARNFYFGLRLTPEPRRSALYAVYAWMRAADDIADSDAPLIERRTRLARFRATTTAVLASASPGVVHPDPLFTALAHTVSTYPIEPSVFSDALDGLEQDLTHTSFETDAQLARYCYRVASSVGLACTAIWGLRPGADPAVAARLAVQLGQAFQRTNILRDFAEDFDLSPSRVYIPQEAFDRFGITADDLRAWSDPAACSSLVLDQVAVVKPFYEASAELERLIDPPCVPTLWAMTRIYRSILGRVEADPSRIIHRDRLSLSVPRKVAIGVVATIRARVIRR